MNNLFSERLLEERQRLAISQGAFAEAGSVQKRAQIYYEMGERMPDAKYLAGVSSLGVDVLYLLTGQRTVQSAAALAPDEMALLDGYRQASTDGKAFIRQAAGMALPQPKAAAKPRTKRAAPPADVMQTASGPGSSIQIGGAVTGSTVFNGETDGDSAAAGRKRATRTSGARR